MKKQGIYKPDDELLRKHLQAELTASEAEALRIQLEADPSAMEQFRRMEKIWQLSRGLKDFQSIDTEKDWSDWKKRITASRPETLLSAKDGAGRTGTSERQIRMSPAFRIMRVAAAIVLAALTASLIYYYTGSGGMSKMDWLTFSSADSREGLVLPEGTRVWLNDGSSLRYPATFKGRKRSVRLEGEGFFEVARNEEKPFIVLAGGEAAVEVLGTSFNLRVDPENKQIFLHVKEGRVAFYPRGKRRQARILGKDEQAGYAQGRITQQTSIDLNFLSWKTRTLEFENTPLPDVVEQLGRHYRKDFRMTDSKLDTLTLTGTYYQQSMEDVLQEIEIVLEVEFREVDGIIQVN